MYICHSLVIFSFSVATSSKSKIIEIDEEPNEKTLKNQ